MTLPTPSLPRPRFAQLGLSLAVAAALAACGGNNNDDDDDANPPAPAAGQTLRTSLNAAGGNTGVEARTSQAPTNGADPSTVYDDFRLATASTIANVAYQGIYCVQANGSPAPAATASQFVVAIYADAAGRPNLAAPLVQTTVTAAVARQTFERNIGNVSCGSATNTTWALYDYRVTLPVPLAVAANTTYWVSVQAISPSYDVYWGWRAGTADNNLSLARFQGAYTSYTLDRAYSLLP